MTTTEAIANAVVILFAPLEGCQLLKFTCSSKSLIPTPFGGSLFLKILSLSESEPKVQWILGAVGSPQRQEPALRCKS